MRIRPSDGTSPVFIEGRELNGVLTVVGTVAHVKKLASRTFHFNPLSISFFVSAEWNMSSRLRDLFSCCRNSECPLVPPMGCFGKQRGQGIRWRIKPVAF